MRPTSIILAACVIAVWGSTAKAGCPANCTDLGYCAHPVEGDDCGIGYPPPPCRGCACIGNRLCVCTSLDGWGCEIGDCVLGETCQGGVCKGDSCDSLPCSLEERDRQCCFKVCQYYSDTNSQCTSVNVPVGTPCDDGDFCNGPDACSPSGHCVPIDGEADNPCPSGNFCLGGCDPDQHRCYPPTDCHETPTDNLCTRDTCDPVLHCRHEPVECNDGNICNGIETCESGVCILLDEPLDCDDGELCTDDRCSPVSGCSNVYNQAPCDDDDACTINDQCVNGHCQGGGEKVCDDDNLCTSDGCCNGQAAPPCNGRTGCIFTETVCNDNIACNVDKCDPATGDCVYECTATSIPRAPEGMIVEPDDHTFVLSLSPSAHLQAGQTYVNNNLKVTRYAGPTDGSGHLVNYLALKNDGLATDAKLTIVAWGVQTGSTHKVHFNGVELSGKLAASSSCEWSTTSFSIPLQSVKFPGARGSNGGKPVGQPNEIKIVVDETPTPTCLRFGAAILTVKLMSPIVLVHGNNSDGGFFGRQGFTQPVFSWFSARHLLYDNSITLDPDITPRSAEQLHPLIRGIVRSFGVDSVHLVAHSKGGLDSREYIERLYPSGLCRGGANDGASCKSHAECGGAPARCKRPFDILSLTTLSTPHNGSVLADLAIKRSKVALLEGVLKFSGFPTMTQPLAYLNSLLASPGMGSLTTDACAAFNKANVPLLTRDIVYNTIAADADCNGNGEIDWTNLAEWETLTYEFIGSVPTVVDPVYQILRTTAEVSLGFVPADPNPGFDIITLYAVPDGVLRDNDTLVTTRSGLGTGTFAGVRTQSGGQSALLRAGSCRQHASVANSATAALVGPWIVAVEQSHGDLK